MRSAALLLLAFTLPVRAEPAAPTCLRYDQPAAIAGTLVRRTFPEQPNYESIAQGDAAATYYLLKTQPVCVAAGRVQGGEQAEQGVDEVQLVFRPEDGMFDRLRPRLGARVACTGTLFHQITGHHHTRVLLETSDCRPQP